MKKFFSLVVIAFLLFSITGCNENKKTDDKKVTKENVMGDGNEKIIPGKNVGGI